MVVPSPTLGGVLLEQQCSPGMPEAITVCNACCGPGCGYVDGWHCSDNIVQLGCTQSVCCASTTCGVPDVQICFLPVTECGGLRCGESHHRTHGRALCSSSCHCCCYFANATCGSFEGAPQLCSLLFFSCCTEEMQATGFPSGPSHRNKSCLCCYRYASNKIHDHEATPPGGAPVGELMVR